MLSRTAAYALRAVLYLSRHGSEERVPVETIAGALDVPRNYLSKTLHTLVSRGVLHSTRGPHGGFSLAVPPETLTLREVVAAFEESPARRPCLLGRGTCSDEAPCPAHRRWSAIGEEIASFFRETTIAELRARPDPSSRSPHGPPSGIAIG